MDDAPRDIILLIFIHLDAVDVCRLALVCRRFRKMTCADVLWRNRLHRDFSKQFENPMPHGYKKHYELRFSFRWQNPRYLVHLVNDTKHRNMTIPELGKSMLLKSNNTISIDAMLLPLLAYAGWKRCQWNDVLIVSTYASVAREEFNRMVQYNSEIVRGDDFPNGSGFQFCYPDIPELRGVPTVGAKVILMAGTNKDGNSRLRYFFNAFIVSILAVENAFIWIEIGSETSQLHSFDSNSTVAGIQDFKLVHDQ